MVVQDVDANGAGGGGAVAHLPVPLAEVHGDELRVGPALRVPAQVEDVPARQGGRARVVGDAPRDRPVAQGALLAAGVGEVGHAGGRPGEVGGEAPGEVGGGDPAEGLEGHGLLEGVLAQGE